MKQSSPPFYKIGYDVEGGEEIAGVSPWMFSFGIRAIR
jgi:hypothetical protein